MQFDVFANPVSAARSALPFVVVLQSDITATNVETIVAPLALRSKFPEAAGRLLPPVVLDGRDFVVVTASLAALPITDLRRKVGNLAAHRVELLGAADLLFFGV
jgi:toxin CcdB